MKPEFPSKVVHMPLELVAGQVQSKEFRGCLLNKPDKDVRTVSPLGGFRWLFGISA